MSESPRRPCAVAVTALVAGLLLAALLYLPGLGGPWLLDDFNNLSPFQDQAAGAAPYRDIIVSNSSGPLGRPVAMASFAANHALGLFSTPALKATNLGLHLLNGLLVFLLLRALLARRAPTDRLHPDTFAALLAVTWTLLPIHISAVLYIVQRMTVLATTFSLLALLGAVHGRALLASRPRRGALLLALGLLVAFPLAIFTKESAATTLVALVLIELFFFRPAQARPLLAALVFLTAALLAALALAPPDFLASGYAGRAFSLGERLLTEPRVLGLYIRAVFLPGPGDLGLFHDDLVVSRSLLAPAGTLPALLGLFAALVASIAAASSRYWAVAFGLAFFLGGHLVESTVLPLELYFEHRNYLPALGLLIALAGALPALPLRPRLLAAVVATWLLVLAAATAYRAATWGDEGRLLEASARHHPASISAVTDWGEYLLARDPARALASVAAAAQAAPANTDVLGLQLLSMHCRLRLAPPAGLVAATAAALEAPRRAALSIRIGLDDILARKRAGECGDADFSPLLPALRAYERQQLAQFGAARDQAWQTRLTLADWMLELGRPQEAAAMLRDIWSGGPHDTRPLAGLALARALAASGDRTALATVLREVDAVTADAPPDFREQLNALREPTKDHHD